MEYDYDKPEEDYELTDMEPLLQVRSTLPTPECPHDTQKTATALGQLMMNLNMYTKVESICGQRQNNRPPLFRSALKN